MIRIASVPIVTLTPVPVRADNTLSIDCTITRINTVLIPTGQHLGTLLVHDTLGPDAGDVGVGVGPVPLRAVAPRPVVPALTQSINTALSQTTGQDTVSVDTFVCQRTLQVTLATRFYTCGVGVAL